MLRILEPARLNQSHEFEYLAKVGYTNDHARKTRPWRPGFLLPFSASRGRLEVASIQIVQLRDITPDNAILEGLDHAAFWFRKYGCGTGAVRERAASDLLYWNARGERLLAFAALYEWVANKHSWHRDSVRYCYDIAFRLLDPSEYSEPEQAAAIAAPVGREIF